MAAHHDIDWRAIRARIAETNGHQADELEADHDAESLDDITRRMTGADLTDIAHRIFKN